MKKNIFAAALAFCFALFAYATPAAASDEYIKHVNKKGVNVKRTGVEPFKNIVFEGLNLDSRVIAADSYRIEIISKEESSISWAVTDGQLKITQNRDLCSKRFNNCKYDKVIVYVPADFSGKEIKSYLISGELDIKGIKSASIYATAASGDIEIKNSKIEGAVLSTSGGDIDISGGNYETIEANTASGNIDVRHIEAKTVKLIATSGEVDFEGLLPELTEIRTSSGKVSVDTPLDASAVNKKFISKSGKISAGKNKYLKQFEESSGAEVSLNIETTSGEIDVDFNEYDD